MQDTIKELLEFIQKSPTSYQAVDTMRKELDCQGFACLSEKQHWTLQAGGKYYVIRNDSALIAFTIPAMGMKQEDASGRRPGLRIIASHGDSPSYRIKENPEMLVENQYVSLNVEGYGGMLCAPWLDRPLSVAGRIVVREKDGSLSHRLVVVDKDLVLIPNLAIHMNRSANAGYTYNAQKDMIPLYGMAGAKDTFMQQIADAAGVCKEEILGTDLLLYNRTPGTVWGAQEEFLSAPRLDDLQCAFASLKGFLSGEKSRHLAMHCVFDNEEVGSSTRQGANSTFLYDVLHRIAEALDMNEEDYQIMLAESFMLSADNAHAVHPNHTDVADPVNRPYLNAGIVLKFNASQKYCTDGVSAAMFRDLCARAQVSCQTFTNRSDMPGGSTLGNISSTRVAVPTADIGLPQLAMHSPYETAGTQDVQDLIRVAQVLFA